MDYVLSLEARRYEAVREGLLKVIPRQAPGLTNAEARKALQSLLPGDLFRGAEADMWMRCVEDDLEARGVLHHEASRWVRVK